LNGSKCCNISGNQIYSGCILRAKTSRRQEKYKKRFRIFPDLKAFDLDADHLNTPDNENNARDAAEESDSDSDKPDSE
jgi:hypothetical protein